MKKVFAILLCAVLASALLVPFTVHAAEHENNMNEIMATAVYVCTTDTSSGSVKEADAVGIECRGQELNAEFAAAVLERSHVHQLEPFAAAGDGAVGEYADDRIPVDERLLDGEVLRAVRDGVQVGHGADRRIAARRCGEGAGAEGLLGGESGLSQMHVDVGESGADQPVL